MKRTSLIVIGAVLASMVGCAAPKSETAPAPGWANGAAAADQVLASDVGVEILRRGGNAVDAAVAMSFTLSVVRPYSCGIGGGGFMVIHLPNDPVHGQVTTALNYRETAPLAVGADFYADGSRSSVRGGAAVGVPGTVAGLLYALEKYGTMERSAVMAPAIRIAEDGFDADAHYVSSVRGLMNEFERNVVMRERYPLVWRSYLHQGALKVGDRIYSPGQARALRLIAAEGASAFYQGAIRDAITAAVTRDGGVMTRLDLAGYAVSEVEPLRFELAPEAGERASPLAEAREIVTMPPPSSGGAAIAQIIGLLGRAPSVETPEDPAAWPEARALALSRLVEASKHAFADRARWMGDPAFVHVPLDWMLSDDRLDEMAGRITPGSTWPIFTYGTAGPAPDDAGTSHFNVGDRWGGVVACTETINTAFGSLVGVDAYGFILNNEMDDFTARPGEPNLYGLVQSAMNSPAPGKRPLSSMSPTIVLDERGEVIAAAGGSGGPRIISATVQVLLNVMHPDNTAPLSSPAVIRVHHQWLPDVLYTEMPLGEGGPMWDETLSSLRAMGYDVQHQSEIGVVQLLIRDRDGRWGGASDPRKGGRARGY